MTRPEMIVAARLAPLDAVTPAPAIPDATRDLSDLTPGARVQARVEAQLAEGGFRVVVAKTPMQMQLPPGIRPGATLELLYVGAQPRPTFVLLQPLAAAENHAVLSPSARLVSMLTQQVRAAAVLTPPYQATPVLDKPPADTAEFGTRLRQAFSQSGLFYEAHQAQWLAGQRTREQLIQEPQGRLPAIVASTVAKAVIAASVQHDSAPAVADPGSPTIARAETARSDAPPAVERLVHKDALPLVQQQLVALDSGQLQWRGEVWPGQTLDWEVGSEPPAGSDAAQTRRWHSRLKLTLPRLGTVTALLALDSHGLRIAVNADNTAAVARLRGGQAALVHAMQQSGLHVGGIEVQTDDHE